MITCKHLAHILSRYWILALCALVVGCGPGETDKTIASSNLILIADVRIESGQKKLFVREILRDKLAKVSAPKVGEQVSPPHQLQKFDEPVMLFYEEKDGRLSWRITASAAQFAALAEGLRQNSGEFQPPKTQSKTRVALGILTLIGLVFLILAMIRGAGVLDRKWLITHPDQKPFRWGYFQALGCVIGGPMIWLLPLLPIPGFSFWSYFPYLLLQGVALPFAGYVLIKKKKRWAWIFISIAQLNMLNLVINYFYGSNRWAEFVD